MQKWREHKINHHLEILLMDLRYCLKWRKTATDIDHRYKGIKSFSHPRFLSQWCRKILTVFCVTFDVPVFIKHARYCWLGSVCCIASGKSDQVFFENAPSNFAEAAGSRKRSVERSGSETLDRNAPLPRSFLLSKHTSALIDMLEVGQFHLRAWCDSHLFVQL